ncbi:MAG: hypothetical protein ACYS8Z_05855 [Planctomycetota bacterium]|jgi:hypothetical protein
MSDSSKYRLMMVLVLAAISLPAAGKESNDPAARLKFEVDQRTVSWTSADSRGRVSRVPVKEGFARPSYRAELFVANLATSRTIISGRLVEAPNTYFQGAEAISGILNTPSGRKVSGSQREFLESGRAIYREGSFGGRVEGHFGFWVYGVSKDDAERTAQAFVQYLTAEGEATKQYWLSERKKIAEELMPEAEKEIADAEEEIKKVQTRFDVLKKSVHYVSTVEAMETVLEFNRMLNDLEVEISGLQAKVAANKEYMAKSNLTEDALTQLQQILGDHIIELAGAQAKKETAAKIRNNARLFYDLDKQLDELPKGLVIKRRSLSSLEKRLKDSEDKINHPYSGTMPPKVFENKVVVNAVHRD